MSRSLLPSLHACNQLRNLGMLESLMPRDCWTNNALRLSHGYMRIPLSSFNGGIRFSPRMRSDDFYNSSIVTSRTTPPQKCNNFLVGRKHMEIQISGARRISILQPMAAKRSNASSQTVANEDGDDRSRKQSALEAAMADINATFGKGSVARLGTTRGALVETFPSGNLALDVALGGGLPKGRIVEIYGPESSGKTTLALHAMAEVQKAGGFAMLIDAEHAFDESYARRLGVNTEDLILIQPDSGEMALESADIVIRSKSVSLICIDSVSALIPRAELEGEIGQNQIGLQARLMSSSLRKLAANASKAGCTIIFLNQIRYKIGVFFGSPETTSGGNALKFFASLRMDIRSAGKIKSPKGDEDIGIRGRVKVVKSKVSRPFRQAEFDILFGHGVSHLGCIADCAETMGIVDKKGSWYSYNDVKLGQGRDKVLQYLRENPEISADIEKQIRARVAEDTRAHTEPGPNVASYTDKFMAVGITSTLDDTELESLDEEFIS